MFFFSKFQAFATNRASKAALLVSAFSKSIPVCCSRYAKQNGYMVSSIWSPCIEYGGKQYLLAYTTECECLLCFIFEERARWKTRLQTLKMIQKCQPHGLILFIKRIIFAHVWIFECAQNYTKHDYSHVFIYDFAQKINQWWSSCQ